MRCAGPPSSSSFLLLPMLAARGSSTCFPRLDLPGYTGIQLAPDADIEFRVRENRQVAKAGTIIPFPARNWSRPS